MCTRWIMPVSCEASEAARSAVAGVIICPEGLSGAMCCSEPDGRIGETSKGGASAGENCGGGAAGARGRIGGAAPVLQGGDVCAGVAGNGPLASGGRFLFLKGKMLVQSGCIRCCCRRKRSSRNC
jgi:hypothetical protein